MKKVEYSRLSRGGPSGVPGSFIVLLTGRGSALMSSRGSHFRGGSGLAISLKSLGMRQGPTGLH